VIKLCERFSCLPSQLDREPATLSGGRPGLLKLLSIIKAGTTDDDEANDGHDEGW